MIKTLTIATAIYNLNPFAQYYISSLNNLFLKKPLEFEWKIDYLMVDDCSTDDVKHLIYDKIETSYKSYYRLEKNSGTHVAYKKALELTNSEFILFLDSDDQLLHGNLLLLLNKSPIGFDLLIFKYYPPIGTFLDIRINGVSKTPLLKKFFLNNSNINLFKITRVSVLREKIGLFNFEFRDIPDIPLAFSAIVSSSNIYLSNINVIRANIRNDSISNSIRKHSFLSQLKDYYSACRYILLTLKMESTVEFVFTSELNALIYDMINTAKSITDITNYAEYFNEINKKSRKSIRTKYRYLIFKLLLLYCYNDTFKKILLESVRITRYLRYRR